MPTLTEAVTAYEAQLNVVVNTFTAANSAASGSATAAGLSATTASDKAAIAVTKAGEALASKDAAGQSAFDANAIKVDLQTNWGDKLALASDKASESATSATASEVSRQASGVSAGLADTAKVAAEAARDALNTTGKVFTFAEGSAAGITVTTNSQQFAVLSADSMSWLIYRNNAGTALAVGPGNYTKAYIDSALLNLLVEPSLVPLWVDEAGNVPVWLKEGLLGALGFTSELLSTLPIVATPFDWPSFVLYSETDGRVIMVAEDGQAPQFFGQTPNVTAVLAPPTVTPTPVHTTGHGLYAWRAKIAALLGGAGVAKILLTGDSWTDHLNETAQALATALYAEYGQAGTGWLSVRADESGTVSQLLNGATLIKSAGWTLHDMDAVNSNSLDGHAVTATGTAATITISALKTQSLKWYYKDTDGAFRYAVDGGAPVTVTGTNTGLRQSVTISGLTDANHSVVFDLVGNASTVTMYGGYATRTAAGVELSKCGNGGATGPQWDNVSALSDDYVADIAPEAIVIILGTNDSRTAVSVASFKASLSAMVSRYLAAAPNACVILVAPPPAGPSDPALSVGYRDAMYALSQELARVEFLSLYDFMPAYAISQPLGLWGDTLHLSPTGGRFTTGLLVNKFLKTN